MQAVQLLASYVIVEQDEQMREVFDGAAEGLYGANDMLLREALPVVAGDSNKQAVQPGELRRHQQVLVKDALPGEVGASLAAEGK